MSVVRPHPPYHLLRPSPQTLQEKSDVPSNFTLKLRKHVRTRRLEAVRQLGVDRVVDFVFGSGEATYHLILEMYSQVSREGRDGGAAVTSVLVAGAGARLWHGFS